MVVGGWVAGFLAQSASEVGGISGFLWYFRVFIALRSNGPHLQASGEAAMAAEVGEPVKEAPAKSKRNSKHAKDAWLSTSKVGIHMCVDTTRCRSLWLLW